MSDIEPVLKATLALFGVACFFVPDRIVKAAARAVETHFASRTQIAPWHKLTTADNTPRLLERPNQSQIPSLI